MDTVADLLLGGDAASNRMHAREDVPPAEAGETVLRRVLLATDLSSVSELATGRAIELAVHHRAQLIVLSVVDPGRLRLPGGRFLRRIDQERARLESEAQLVVARARAAGARATFLVWEGDPAEAILEASQAEDADLIVLGSHGRGVIGRLVLGSISARVAEGARCRVMIVGARAAGR